MPSELYALTWTLVPDWTRNRLILERKTPGILCFELDGHPVYFAAEAKHVGNYTRFLTPGGSWKSHPGGRLIHEHRRSLLLYYAVVDATRRELDEIRDALNEHHQAAFFEGERKPKR